MCIVLDLFFDPVPALEAVFQADQGPVGIFGFDAVHSRGDDFAFELLDPGATLVDRVPPVVGIDGGPVRHGPFQAHGLLGAGELVPLSTVTADPPARGRVDAHAPISIPVPVPVAVRRSGRRLTRRSGPARLVGFV